MKNENGGRVEGVRWLSCCVVAVMMAKFVAELLLLLCGCVFLLFWKDRKLIVLLLRGCVAAVR